jgi:hypothetical protein
LISQEDAVPQRKRIARPADGRVKACAVTWSAEEYREEAIVAFAVMVPLTWAGI